MTDWVNWQQYSDLNKTEVQRESDAQTEANRATAAQMQRALSGLGDAAGAQAHDGAYKGISSIASYGDVMKQRDAALKNDTTNLGALQRAPWESELYAGQPAQQNPWANLTKRLGEYDDKYTQANNVTQRRKAAEARDQSERDFNKAQQAKRDAAEQPRKDAGAAYSAWSDAVQKGHGANYTGSPNAGAYYDAWNKPGAAQPPTHRGVNNQPWTPDTRNKVGRANLPQDPTTSNFGQNTSDWSF